MHRYEIIVLDGYTLNPGDLSWDNLSKLGELTVYNRTPADKTIERIGNAEIVYTNKTVISKEVFEQCKNIKFVGVLATGYNVVDAEAAKSKNVVVTNIPAYGTTAVAQLAIALLLEICHHAGDHNVSVREGNWTKCQDYCYWEYPLIELFGKTMGIVGMGRIGAATANIARALGMNVIYHDSFINPEIQDKGYQYVTLDELFAQADVISLHCPLFDNTKGIINKQNIAKMRDGVIIINTSRGQLVDENDLADALNNGKVYAAGLDVVSAEPIKHENPLLNAKNCIITPHIAWAPKESRKRLMNTAIENLVQFLKGKPINVVN